MNRAARHIAEYASACLRIQFELLSLEEKEPRTMQCWWGDNGEHALLVALHSDRDGQDIVASFLLPEQVSEEEFDPAVYLAAFLDEEGFECHANSVDSSSVFFSM